MKGMITPILIWTLAASPAMFAAGHSPRKLYFSVAAIAGAFGIVLWVASAGFGYGVTENMTSSLNGHIYIHKKSGSFRKGDLVAYRWRGGATYPTGTTFIKHVVGMPGDLVRRDGSAFWVAGQYVGIAKPESRAGVPLTPAGEGVIGPAEYFLANPSPDSLDSRYALSGNVKQAEIIGKAYEIF